MPPPADIKRARASCRHHFSARALFPAACSPRLFPILRRREMRKEGQKFCMRSLLMAHWGRCTYFLIHFSPIAESALQLARQLRGSKASARILKTRSRQPPASAPAAAFLISLYHGAADAMPPAPRYTIISGHAVISALLPAYFQGLSARPKPPMPTLSGLIFKL